MNSVNIENFGQDKEDYLVYLNFGRDVDNFVLDQINSDVVNFDQIHMENYSDVSVIDFVLHRYYVVVDLEMR